VISAKVREEPEAGCLGVRQFSVDRESGLFTPLTGAASVYDPAEARKHYGNSKQYRTAAE
jgi:hypothetical protein